ncbi:MAG: multinuclear nonheme iron-dependent oxidase [Nannocystales bacterium]
MQVGLSLMLDDAFRQTALPLFEAGVVDAIEYSFELGWAGPRPSWAEALLRHYGGAGRLWGHGVTFSPLSSDAAEHHAAWLARVAQECAVLELQGLSEHYGFMGAGHDDVGAPLPPPPLPEVTELGTTALGALAVASGVPVGIENLALALSPQDVYAQPRLIAQILDALDGYLVLDLHNLWCQATNFGLDPLTLLGRYPLHRARVVHLSGGSWSTHATTRFRRDTHDGQVPEPVLALLPEALSRCSDLQAVILEQLGPSLDDPGAAQGFREDFARVREVCA